MNKSRTPLQVSPKFSLKLKELQRKIRMSGGDRSLRDLTEDLASSSVFDEVEKRLIAKDNNTNFEIKIKMDRRGLF